MNARRDQSGEVDCHMEIELPEIKELICQNGFEERLPAMSYGNAHTVWAAGYSSWPAY